VNIIKEKRIFHEELNRHTLRYKYY